MQIASSQVDHENLQVGLHQFEFFKVGEETIFSYDLRFVKPLRTSDESFKLLSAASIHTIEHLLAFYLRAEAAKNNDNKVVILSVFPYGCQTGFGCLSTLTHPVFKPTLLNAIRMAVTQNEIPFSSTIECGNVFLNDLVQAKIALKQFYSVVQSQTYDSIIEISRINTHHQC